MKNTVRELIPLWREFLSQCGIDKNNIINVNSYFKSDMSLINNDGTLLNGRTTNDNLLLFEIKVNKMLISEQNKSNMNCSYECNFEIDIYGNNANEISLKIYNKLLSNDYITWFIKRNIGISPLIDINVMYETIHNVQWLRSNIVIPFTYEYETTTLNEEVKELKDINII